VTFPYEALPSLAVLAVAVPAIGLGYIIFGMIGFGTVFVATPVLAYIMPPSAIVPLLAIMDCVATTSNGIRLNEKVALGELIGLVPLMMLGSVVGAWLLLTIPARPMMAALALFFIAYALYGLFAPAPRRLISRGWIVPLGGLGGVFSAMFGSGGFLYIMYLSRRLTDKDAIRATQSAVLSIATLTRVVIFALAGVYSDLTLPMLALCLAPIMVLGIWLGERVTVGLSREQFLRVLYVVLIGAGVMLLFRAAATT
jgi:uncharacterized membrane protein YfcA